MGTAAVKFHKARLMPSSDDLLSFPQEQEPPVCGGPFTNDKRYDPLPHAARGAAMQRVVWPDEENALKDFPTAPRVERNSSLSEITARPPLRGKGPCSQM